MRTHADLKRHKRQREEVEGRSVKDFLATNKSYPLFRSIDQKIEFSNISAALKL